MKQTFLFVLSGAGSISLGLAYVLHAFGPTEAEVVLWGQVSICVGLALLLMVNVGQKNSRAVRGIASLGCVIAALLQVLPILLWFTFHGTGISDGVPPSAFVTHWAYAIPHLVVLAASIANLHALWARPKVGQRPRNQLTG